MAKKMYYTEEEATAALGITVDGLQELVRDQKLRAYDDGTKKMYKGEEVEALMGPSVESAEQEIELTPADTTADAISLADATNMGTTAAKEDTIITAEGISIFDEEDLEIEDADPMAKTQIAPSLEDQIAVEGVGSGSGLLDLTRESDDTSLGADLLDNIDSDEEVAEPFAQPVAPDQYAQQAEVAVTPAPVIEAADSSAGFFNGVLLGSFLLALVIGCVSLAVASGTVPGYVKTLESNTLYLLIGGLVVAVICGVLGMVLSKSAKTA